MAVSACPRALTCGERLPKGVDMRKPGGTNKIRIALRMHNAGKSVDDILTRIQ